MEKAEEEKLALALINMIDQKREKIKRLTCEIIELENDPKNVVKIKQDVQSVLNAVASFSSDSEFLAIIALDTKMISTEIQMETSKDTQTINAAGWHALVVPELENFCIYANSWNPIKSDFGKGAKIIINFPKTLNIASIVNYLQGKK
jgi:hypothetical protein